MPLRLGPVGAIGLILALVLAPAFGQSPEPRTFALLTIGGLGAFAIFAALQLPLFFTLGFSRARPFAFVAPVIAAAIVLVIVGRDTSLLGNIAVDFGAWSFVGAMAATGAAAFAGSAALSVRLYARRDL